MKLPSIYKPSSCRTMCPNVKDCYEKYIITINTNCLMFGYIDGMSEDYGYPELRKLINESTQDT